MTAENRDDPSSGASRIRVRPASTGRRAARAARARRRREERALTEALRSEADASTRARPVLLSLLSHDLRNPLSVMTLNLPSIDRAVPPEHPNRRQVEMLRRAAEELAQMLQHTGEAARVDRGDVTLVLGTHEIGPVIGAALDLVQRAAHQKEIAFQVDVAERLPAVCCDRDRVVRALGALLCRAVRVSPKKGAVIVRAVHDDEDGVLVSVTDAGAEIPEAYVDAVFEIPDDDQHRHATGACFVLDLFVVRGTIDALGGRVWVERGETAEPGARRGSTFFVTLPVT
jgi:signal transduction histidine kinase